MASRGSGGNIDIDVMSLIKGLSAPFSVYILQKRKFSKENTKARHARGAHNELSLIALPAPVTFQS